MRLARALIVATAVYVLMAWRLVAPLHASLAVSLACGLALLASFSLMILYPLSWWRGGRLRAFARRRKVRRVSQLMMAFGSFLVTAVLARDALWVTIGWFLPRSIRLERWSSVGAVGLALLMFGWGWLQVRLGPRTKRVRVPIENLPSALAGFRIVQLSDVHIGETVRREHIERMVHRVNQLGADIIAITGDSRRRIRSLSSAHTPRRSPISSRAPAPTLSPAITSTTRGSGSGCLISSSSAWWSSTTRTAWCARSCWSRASTILGSTDDPAADVRRSLRGAPDHAVCILLAHHPKTALAASKERVDLQLSGHTHGGQFVPWTLLVRFVHRFNAGLYRVEQMWLYVSRGTFYWGPPIRLMAPAEITVIELA